MHNIQFISAMFINTVKLLLARQMKKKKKKKSYNL